MPAKAGHPVITSLAVCTGSSAFADDDRDYFRTQITRTMD